MPTPNPVAIPAVLAQIDTDVFVNTAGQIDEPKVNNLLKLITVSLQRYAQSIASVGFEPKTLLATAAGQTVFPFPPLAEVPAGAKPVIVARFSEGVLDPDTQYTADLNARTLTLVSPEPAIAKDEKLLVVYQVASPAAVGGATEWRINAGNLEYSTNEGLNWTVAGSLNLGNVQTKLANVAAILAVGAPNESYTYTPVDDNGERTRLEKIDGVVYETAQLIPYAANP